MAGPDRLVYTSATPGKSCATYKPTCAIFIKPDHQRLREFSTASLPVVEAGLLAESPLYRDYEIMKLGWSLSKLREKERSFQPGINERYYRWKFGKPFAECEGRIGWPGVWLRITRRFCWRELYQCGDHPYRQFPIANSAQPLYRPLQAYAPSAT